MPDSTASTSRFGDELWLDDGPAEEAAPERAPLREALRLDEAGEDRVHLDAARREQAGERARERELRVLRGRVRPAGREGDGARDRDDVDDVRARLEARLEGAHAPDAAEVVRPQHRLDALRLEREEVGAAGDARVVDEQVDPRVPLEDRRGRALDRRAVGDVAELELAAELRRERLEPLLPPRDEHAAPASPGELSRRRLADPARGAGDDG